MENEDLQHHLQHHYHAPEEKRRQLNRISRIIGHMQKVKSMIDRDEDCADVLVQLAAIRAATTGLGKEIINEHIAHCISHAVEEGDVNIINEFKKAIEKFL